MKRARAMLVAIAFAVGCLAFAGCERSHKPNVVLIVLDTLRGEIGRASCRERVCYVV